MVLYSIAGPACSARGMTPLGAVLCAPHPSPGRTLAVRKALGTLRALERGARWASAGAVSPSSPWRVAKKEHACQHNRF